MDDNSDDSRRGSDHSGVRRPSASSPEDRAWTLLSEADAAGDLDVEEVLTEALAALRPPPQPDLAAGTDVRRPLRELLPHIWHALDEATGDERDAAVRVRAARAAHILRRVTADGATQNDGANGPGRSPLAAAWPSDLRSRQPMPPLLLDAWWFLCAAQVVADASTETRLRNAIAVLLDASPYELGTEPPQTIPWPDAIHFALVALTAYAETSPDPVEILRAARAAAALNAMAQGQPA